MTNSDYKILVSPRAQIEIEGAIAHYQSLSKQAPSNFIQSLKDCYVRLKTNPNYAISYKQIRSVKINKFPYSLFYIIKYETKTIEVLSCFHNKRSPEQQPKS